MGLKGKCNSKKDQLELKLCKIKKPLPKWSGFLVAVGGGIWDTKKNSEGKFSGDLQVPDRIVRKQKGNRIKTGE